jgi:TRAP-type C4-dicarboxylate transport system substrate-binding protein
MFRLISITGALAAAATIALGPAQAQTTLRIDSWISPKHVQNAIVFPKWVEALEKATNGRVTARISYPPRTHPKTMLDRAKSGVADITWGFHGYTPGRFVLTKIVELPGLGANAYEASVAYQRIYERYLAKANEHAGVKVLTVFSHGPGVIHTKRAIRSIDDFKGMKIRLGGGVMGAVGKALGVVAVPAPATKVYELLSQGVADGVFMPMGEKKSLKIKEVAPFTLVMPKGLYYGSFFIAMNPRTFSKLSKADQAALDSVSGENLARIAGRAWTYSDEVGLKDALAAGNTIVEAKGALLKAIRGRIAGIEADWIKQANAKGIDAAKALAALRTEVAKLKSTN